jgi:hypothetical protein
MKRMIGMMVVAGLVGTLSPARAEKMTPGPKGGRLLENEAPRAEFFVEKDRKVTLTFYDANLKAVPAGEQTATVIAEAKGGKTKIEFEKKGDVLISKAPLPEGNDYIVVVQLRAKVDSKPQNFRIKYNAIICEKCKRAEYACICDE